MKEFFDMKQVYFLSMKITEIKDYELHAKV